jgi:hypothetical protein
VELDWRYWHSFYMIKFYDIIHLYFLWKIKCKRTQTKTQITSHVQQCCNKVVPSHVCSVECVLGLTFSSKHKLDQNVFLGLGLDFLQGKVWSKAYTHERLLRLPIFRYIHIYIQLDDGDLFVKEEGEEKRSGKEIETTIMPFIKFVHDKYIHNFAKKIVFCSYYQRNPCSQFPIACYSNWVLMQKKN